MIDLSHLTEEEQGMIMTVLKRDAELKKAEEERIGKLQKLLSSGSQSDTNLKYLTGEWFYEVKSRRHMDKIHGSEIILASMKQRKAGGLDGSLKFERSRASSGRGSDIVAPPKPARRMEIAQSQEMRDAEKEKLNSGIRSPGRPRHNPFNRASLILVEPPEKTEEPLTNGDQEFPKSPETDTISPLNNHPAGQASQTSGGSVTSEGSSVGFRPVPKKRTFLSRRSSTQTSEVSSSGSGPQAGSKVIVPAPRVSLQRGSSGGSNQSSLRGTEEMSQKTATTTSHQVSHSGQPPKSPNEASQQPMCDISQVSSNTELERDSNLPSIAREGSVENSSYNSYHKPLLKPPPLSTETDNLCISRADTYTKSDGPSDRVTVGKHGEKDDLNQRESLPTNRNQDSDRSKNSTVETAGGQEELSLTESIVETPVRYDLNFTEKTDQPSTKKSNQKLKCKLSPQTPTGDEEDSIAKVLEWFSRSTDSSEWLDAEDSPKAINNTDRQEDITTLRSEDVLTRDDEDVYEPRVTDRKSEAVEIKRDPLQRQANEAKDKMGQIKLRTTDRMESKEVTEVHEDVKHDVRAHMKAQEVNDNEDESQVPKISHLKSFWEKGNTGPKILISRSNTISDKGQKPVYPPVEKGRQKEVNENEEHICDMPSGVKGKYDRRASNTDEREKEQLQSVISQKDIGDYSPAPEMHTSPTYEGKHPSSGSQMEEEPKHNTDYLASQAGHQLADRRDSDTEFLSLTTVSPLPRTHLQSRLSLESEGLSPQPDSISQSTGSPMPVKSPLFISTTQQEELPGDSPTSQLDTNLQTRNSADPEKLYLSRNSPCMDYQRGGKDVQCTPKTLMRRGSSEDGRWRDSEDRGVQSSMASKKKEDLSNKDRTSSPHSQRQGPKHQESTAERIKQLKSFWEQERNKPVFYTGKSKGSGDGRVSRGANLAKLNKRYTKSEYDLTSIGNDSNSDAEESDRTRQNFTILPLNHRLDKLSPSLGTNRAQFNNLREFWGEAASVRRGSLSFDKPKSSRKRESIDAQPSASELKCADPEFYRKSSTIEKNNTRPNVKSSPPCQNRSKSPHDRQMGSGSGSGNDNKGNLAHYATAEMGQQRDSRRGSKESAREEKPTKSQNSLGKEARPPKSKKDSFGNTSGRASSLRRATSMFALDVSDQDQPFVGQLKKTPDASPVHSQSRRQTADRMQGRRQSTEKGATSRRLSEECENLAPRARAFVPRDYRHYLGMTEKSSVHTSLAPAMKEQGSEGKTGYELDVSGPVRASTPVSSEERYSRKGIKLSQRPLWAGYSSSDTGQESSVSSTSETWSNSRNSSNRENDDEDQNPVRKALRRAEARPKNLAKSMEDITASSTPRQERRQDPIADLRRISDVPSIPSTASSSFSDPEHLKKMSKSVPSFLQKEGDGRDPDSTSEDSYHRGQARMGRSVTNLTSSSSMASASSLSGSVMTMYSGDFGNVEVQGNIQFSINYVQKLREFHIFVAQCQDLGAVDPKRGRSDPYVKSYLVPDKANLGKRKTSVKKKTLNPTFNEILRYRVRMEYLRTQTLILSVWHHDTFGRNSFLGEVDVDLSKWDFDHTQMNYLALKARTTPTLAPSNDRGEMRIAIRFLPQITHSEGVAKDGPNTGEIHIWVKECKNLPLIRATIDPYVKCFVLPDTSRKSRQKTRVLRRTVDPIFNHTMVYDGIREEDLTEACVELTVWDRDRLASNLLGGLRLGPGTGKSYGAVVDWMDSTQYEVAMWERMMAAPNEWVEEVLPLRILTSAKTALK